MPPSEIVLFQGVTTTVKVAQVRVCHIRMMFAGAYMCESLGLAETRTLGADGRDRERPQQG